VKIKSRDCNHIFAITEEKLLDAPEKSALVRLWLLIRQENSAGLAKRPVPGIMKIRQAVGGVCLHLPRWPSPFLNPGRRASEVETPDGFVAVARKTKVWSKVMAQVCDICGKGPQYGNNVSHAHNITRRRWNVNLQAVKALVNGQPKRIRVCASCIKSGKIAKA
jgi:large subunit ribosomal protein L28